MRAYDIICKKRDGLSLDHDEIRFLIQAYLGGDVTDGQMAAFIMAVAIRECPSRKRRVSHV